MSFVWGRETVIGCVVVVVVCVKSVCTQFVFLVDGSMVLTFFFFSSFFPGEKYKQRIYIKSTHTRWYTCACGY